MRFLFVTVFCFFAAILNGQNGFVSGIVIDRTNHDEPALGAMIRIDSTRMGAQADFDGKFLIRNVPPGVYRVSCKFTGHWTIADTAVVTAGDTVFLQFYLTRETCLSDTLSEAQIILDLPEDEPFTTTGDIHTGTNSATGMGGKEAGKYPVTDAGQLSRKLPGVTLVDNRFIVVRGLSERYNAVQLNGVNAPSVESDAKAFSFNLVPAPMIERFMIYRSPSADLPAEFGGGVVKLSTKVLPEDTSLTINYQIGYRNGTTLHGFQTNRVGNLDFLGLGNQSRDFPAGFPANLNSVDGAHLPNIWGYETIKALPDQRFSATYKFRSGQAKFPHFLFGNVSSLSYSNTNAYFNQRRLDYYSWNAATGTSDTLVDYNDANYVNSVRIAFLQNNSIRLDRNRNIHRFTLRNLFNLLADNESTFRTGKNFEEGDFREEYSYHYTQRTIYSVQAGGEHTLNDERTKIDYSVGFSYGMRSDPDWRRARYSKPFSAPAGPFTLYIPIAPQPFFLGRLFVSMQEYAVAVTGNAEQVIRLGADKESGEASYEFKLKAGIYSEVKNREFRVRNLGYKAVSMNTYQNTALFTLPIDQVFSPENLNTSNGLELAESSNAANMYMAQNELVAAYALVILPVGKFIGSTDSMQHERMRVGLGVRGEYNSQQLNSSRINGDTLQVVNNQFHLLPSVNVAYNLDDRWLARISYGRTLNRSEFREIAPLYFFDFISNSINVGNDSLQTAIIDNYEASIEFYPRPGENITVSTFYKHFTNPIEMYFVPGAGGGGVRSFTWGNAPEAVSYGMEIEVRKKLDSLNIGIIRNVSVIANAAYIFSEIRLVEDQNTSTNKPRTLMGQSPWIVNAGLFYENDSAGLQVNAMYNVIGPRIIVAGVMDIPEIYEMPRHQLDFSIVKTVGPRRNIDLRLNIVDVLNQNFVHLQDKNGDGLDLGTDNRIMIVNRGRYFTLGVNVKLLGR